MAARYRHGPRKSRQDNPSAMEGKLFIQLLVCAAIVCSFMIFKDTALPGGKTPAQYAEHILNTTVNMDSIMAAVKGSPAPDQSVPVTGAGIDQQATPSPTPSPTPTPVPTEIPATE